MARQVESQVRREAAAKRLEDVLICLCHSQEFFTVTRSIGCRLDYKLNELRDIPTAAVSFYAAMTHGLRG